MPQRLRDTRGRVCHAFMCIVEEDLMWYRTVLPNGTQLQVTLCSFHALELEEIDFDLRKAQLQPITQEA